MWYVILIFVIVFEGAISFVAPYFPNLTIDSIDVASLGAESQTIVENADSIVDVVDIGLNAGQMFAGIMTFKINGAETFSILFYLGIILIFICIVRLIRDGG